MKEITEIRRENLKLIEADLGSQKALADRVDKTPGYINQLIIGYRSIGEKSARKLEAALKKPIGWLDTDQNTIEGTAPNGKPESHAKPEAELIEPGDRFLPVRMAGFHLQAGVTGYTVDYLDEEKTPIFFRAEWFISNGYKPEKLIACPIKGDSMEPRLYAGDIAVINLDSVQPKDGKVFAVNYEGELVIKRMKRDRGEWFLSSDNPDKIKHPDKACTSDICIPVGEVVYRQSSEI